MRFATLEDFAAHLDGLGLFHMNLTLDRVRAFLSAWGGDTAPFVAAHVVGTNGKGSTSAFLDSLARAHGLSVGLSTSPHFVDLRERVLVDGDMLPGGDWLGAANAVWSLAPQAGLTYFEYLTCLALVAFEMKGVDLAVLEAGLGGRFDAVSALSTDVTLITPIGLDHMKVLGPTVADIARDKAGAMKPGVPALTVAQAPEAMAVLAEEAARVGAPLIPAQGLWTWEGADLVPAPELELDRIPDVALGLAGWHQRENARLALSAWTVLARDRDWGVSPQACREGLASAFVPGRMQSVPGDPPLILDGGHNAHGLAALGEALERQGTRPEALVFACLRDKDFEPMLPLLLSLTDGPVLVPDVHVPDRAWPAADLAARMGPRARPAPDVHAALESLKGAKGPVLVCGSLYLLAEFYTKRAELLRPRAPLGAADRG
jgi:dihydrofolate synthase/folylpolyglutamate synthase